MTKQRLSQSEIDGVQYRRAKLWQIILVAFNAFNGMGVYILFNNYVGYAANNAEFFEILPSKKGAATLRPALLEGETLLLAGKATELER